MIGQGLALALVESDEVALDVKPSLALSAAHSGAHP